MTDIDQAKASQLRNIEAKTGRSVQALCDEIGESGKIKHGEVRSWVMDRFSLGYGDANALARAFSRTIPTSRSFRVRPSRSWCV